MKFLQNTFKSQIGLVKQSNYGYIYQSKEFFQDQYITSIYIVNTFNFFLWRVLDHIEMQHNSSISQLPLSTLQQACYTVLPNGQTILSKISKNMQEVQNLFQRLKSEHLPGQKGQFYVPVFSFFVEEKEGLQKASVLDQLFGRLPGEMTKTGTRLTQMSSFDGSIVEDVPK
mmetsp:Transcript_18836/g.13657  ORF Transcript_18836/g.13657 Transcript_18836/m.13657 type:complete len:171 (-) Transcript_18836:1867-2379(-)